MFNLGGKCGFIDREGNIVVPIVYDYCLPYLTGLTSVLSNEKWEFIDRSGKVAIPFKYDKAAVGKGGMLYVLLNGKQGVIDRFGNVVIPLEYDTWEAFIKDCQLLKKKINMDILIEKVR